MIKNIIISLVILYGGSVAFQGDHQAIYNTGIQYIAGHSFTLLAYGFAGSMALIALSLILGVLGFYTVMFLVGQFFFWLSQLVISLISVGAVVFWFTFNQNLWWDIGFVVSSIPYLVLFASGFSLKQFDFNYPLNRAIESSIALPILSGLIIFGSVYLSG